MRQQLTAVRMFAQLYPTIHGHSTHAKREAVVNGTKPVCMLFENELLQDKDGWLQRCKQCVKEFGDAT